ncbi:MAG: IPT/TIG domain-containing protein [Hyphomicrobium sp.]
MTQANTEIKCNSIAGIGTNHRLTVSTSDQPSALSDPSVVLSYAPPTITGATSIPSILQLPAAGSRQITIGGTNFGDGTTVPTVAYGPYTAIGCSVTSAHVQIKCNNIIGVGANHIISVSIGGQTSAQTTFVASYLAPSISSVTSSTSLSTSGGTLVTLNGANFGTAAVAGSVVGVYSAAAAPSLFYTTDPCVFVAPADGRLQCPTIAGVGNALSWTVTIGGQTNSPAFLSAVAYVSPSLSNVISALLNSDGGDPIVIQGSNFGPATTPNNLIQVVYGPGGNAFTATGCSITTAQTEVTCTSMAGAGLGTGLRLTIANLFGTLSSPTPTYNCLSSLL